MWEYTEQITPGYSLSQVTVPVTVTVFDKFQQEYTSDTCLRSTMENDIRGKSKISYGNVKCFHLISIRKYSGNLAQFFNLIIRVLFMLFAMQIKSFFFNFWLCVKNWRNRGGVSELFFMLVDECIVWEKRYFWKQYFVNPYFMFLYSL